MLKTERRTIDGLDIQISQLPAMQSLLLWSRICGLAVPTLGDAVASIPKNQLSMQGLMDRSDGLEILGKALGGLFKALTPSELESLTRELLSTAQIIQNGRTADLMTVFDEVFRGRIDSILKTLVFAIQVNYGSFRNVLSALAAKQAGQPSSAASTPSSPPGQVAA